MARSRLLAYQLRCSLVICDMKLAVRTSDSEGTERSLKVFLSICLPAFLSSCHYLLLFPLYVCSVCPSSYLPFYISLFLSFSYSHSPSI